MFSHNIKAYIAYFSVLYDTLLPREDFPRKTRDCRFAAGYLSSRRYQKSWYYPAFFSSLNGMGLELTNYNIFFKNVTSWGTINGIASSMVSQTVSSSWRSVFESPVILIKYK